MWNPDTEEWTLLDQIDAPRTYHSVALLLPDARVFAGGGGLCGDCDVNHFDGQIFSPPYLFEADGSAASRPSISISSSTVMNGQDIQVTSSQPLQTIAIVRYGSATHSVNTDQRRLEICGSRSTSCTDGTLNTLTVPSDPGIAPPGYWMVFGINDAGVPSISAQVRIRSTESAGSQFMSTMSFDTSAGSMGVSNSSRLGTCLAEVGLDGPSTETAGSNGAAANVRLRPAAQPGDSGKPGEFGGRRVLLDSASAVAGALSKAAAAVGTARAAAMDKVEAIKDLQNKFVCSIEELKASIMGYINRGNSIAAQKVAALQGTIKQSLSTILAESSVKVALVVESALGNTSSSTSLRIQLEDLLAAKSSNNQELLTNVTAMALHRGVPLEEIRAVLTSALTVAKDKGDTAAQLATLAVGQNATARTLRQVLKALQVGDIAGKPLALNKLQNLAATNGVDPAVLEASIVTVVMPVTPRQPDALQELVHAALRHDSGRALTASLLTDLLSERQQSLQSITHVTQRAGMRGGDLQALMRGIVADAVGHGARANNSTVPRPGSLLANLKLGAAMGNANGVRAHASGLSLSSGSVAAKPDVLLDAEALTSPKGERKLYRPALTSVMDKIDYRRTAGKLSSSNLAKDTSNLVPNTESLASKHLGQAPDVRAVVSERKTAEQKAEKSSSVGF